MKVIKRNLGALGIAFFAFGLLIGPSPDDKLDVLMMAAGTVMTIMALALNWDSKIKA